MPSGFSNLRSDGSSQSSPSSERRVDGFLRVRLVRNGEGRLLGRRGGRSVSEEGLGLSEESSSLLDDDLLDLFESRKIIRERSSGGRGGRG